MKVFKDAEGGLLEIAHSYKKFGMHVREDNSVVFNEWAPAALSLSLFGDFNNWNREQYYGKKNQYGCWQIVIPPAADGSCQIKHYTKYKIRIEGPDHIKRDKNSAWATYCVQNKESFLYDCVYWHPEKPFEWTHERPVKDTQFPNQSLRIYESHVGMAQEHERVSSYRDFADYNLDRIVKAGYNTIQLMAIQEHSYYASFGYHVTSFFGVSSRSGTPDDFKYLVNKAHGCGLKIIIDLVHSHASNNSNDGIN